MKKVAILLIALMILSIFLVGCKTAGEATREPTVKGEDVNIKYTETDEPGDGSAEESDYVPPEGSGA